jgi:hypothetical protein
MKLSGGAFPLRRRRERHGGPFLVAIVAAAGVSKTTDDARRCRDGRHRAGGVLCCPQSARRCVSAEDWGVSDPPFQVPDFAPGRPDARVAHAPAAHLSLSRRLSGVHRLFFRAARRSSGCVTGCAYPPENETHGRPVQWRTAAERQRSPRPSRIRALSCARRRARLVASLRPTRVVRAWPSGLDGACAQLAG